MSLPLRGNSSLTRSHDLLTRLNRDATPNNAPRESVAQTDSLLIQPHDHHCDRHQSERSASQKSRGTCIVIVIVSLCLLVQVLQTFTLLYIYKSQVSPLLPQTRQTLANAHNITEEILSPSTQVVVDQIKYRIVPSVLQNLHVLYALPHFINETEVAIAELRRLLRRFEPPSHHLSDAVDCVGAFEQLN